MLYIGEGYYYKVYALESGRVIKKLQPYWFSFRKIFFYTRTNGKPFFKALIGAHKARLKEMKALQTIKEKINMVPREMFANAMFLQDLDYSQDRVTIINDLMEKNTFAQNKKIIDQYIAFQKALWSYGMHDKTYKLQVNYGLDRRGRLVCVDFGEFVYTQEEAIKSIIDKRWLARNTYKHWNDARLKKYYTDCMENVMRKEILKEYWNKV
jgi:hypothetical protein